MTEPDLTHLLREHVSRHSTPGAAVGILREGSVAFGCCGVADVSTSEMVTPDTRFAIGSLGKSMVATAVARLADAGRLPSLDDPVAAHVPELRETAWAQSATVRDLLANRSRLPLLAELEFSGFTGEEDDVLSRFAARIAKEEPTARFWSYTNAGWCLLGRAIENLTGLSWEDAMRASLLEPLGMQETTFSSRPVAEPRASGHDVTADGSTLSEPWTPRALGPAGSTLLSTVSDLLRFAACHLDDPSLAALRVTHADVSIHGWLDGWCLGWARFDWDGGPAWGWDGVIPGQRAFLRIVPQRRGAVVLLTNGSNGRAVYRSLFSDLVPAWFDVGLPELRLEPTPGAAGELSRFAGVYAWPDRHVEVSATGEGLVISDERSTVEALAVDDRTFLVNADDPDTPTVTFGAVDDSGRPGVLYEMLWGLPRVSTR